MLPKKIIFDTNIFNERNWLHLKKSKLLEKVQKNELQVLGHPTLFEETLYLFFGNKKHLLNKYMNYLFNIPNQKWFRPRKEIIQMELDDEINRSNSIFLSKSEVNNLKYHIRNDFMSGRMDSVDKIMHQLIIGKHAQQNEGMRSKLVSIRKRISKERKKLEKIGDKMSASFANFSRQFVDDFGRPLLYTLYEGKNDKASIFIKWKKNKEKYPYFSLWYKAFLYMPFHAAVEHNTKIDVNAQKDIDFIVLLRDADILISDDMGFMRDAFNNFWRDKKILYCLDDFISSIKIE